MKQGGEGSFIGSKKLQINFAGVEKNPTFAVPNKRGIKKELKARCLGDTKTEDLIPDLLRG